MSNVTVDTQTTARALGEKIKSRQARVGIVGLGYVGLPLAVEFAKSGFTVTGIDLSESKTSAVNAGESYIGDIPSSRWFNPERFALPPIFQRSRIWIRSTFAFPRRCARPKIRI